MSLNRAMVIGNLGGDPVLRNLPSGQQAVGFSIATDESFTDKEGQKKERVEWLSTPEQKYINKPEQKCISLAGVGLSSGRRSARGISPLARSRNCQAFERLSRRGLIRVRSVEDRLRDASCCV